MIQNRFIYLVLVFLFSACSDGYHPVIVDYFDDDNIPFHEKFQRVLTSEYLSELGFNEEQILWLQAYYEQRKFQPHWVNDSMINQNGLRMRHLLKRTLWFGIPENRSNFLPKRKHKHWIEEELTLTARFASLLADVTDGFINLEIKKYKSQSFAPVENIDSLLSIKRTIDYDRLLLNQNQGDTNYRFFSSQLYRFCFEKGLDKTQYVVYSAKADSIKSRKQTEIALFAKKYLAVKNPTDEEFKTALTKFQKDNGLRQDAVVGVNTIKALHESNYHKVLRAALSLEKIRSQDSKPEKYVNINIPEYLLRLVVGDTLRQVHRVIVGKPENKTPQLRSKIHQIVLFPYWNVPYSIATKEVLPLVKRNPSYLLKNHYKIYKGDFEVNPYNVNWRRIKQNSFPYRLVQQPGLHNSLGIIKFEFHSNYSVYLHDTPSKQLFNKDVRAFSHGCMRCQYPDSLAKTLLSADTFRKKFNSVKGFMLDSLLALRDHRIIKIMHPVPVFVTYQTVVANRNALVFYMDIYKRDEEYLKIMVTE
jgi:murein L,D-transpeptidase YcbB/YkuD